MAAGQDIGETSPASLAPAERHPIHAWWTVAILMILNMASLLDRNILSLMIIEVRKDLGLTDFQVSLLQGLALSAVYCTFGIIFGVLIDRHPAKRMIYIGVTVFAAAAAACGLARSYVEMFVARMVTGAGQGALGTGGQVVIMSLFPKHRVSLPITLYAVAGTAGIGVSYFGGGLLLEALTAHSFPGLESLAPWRQVLIVAAAPGLLLAFLCFTFLDGESAKSRAEAQPPSWREFGAFIMKERAFFGRIGLGLGLIANMNYSVMSWAPTYARRVLDMSPGAVGTQMGLIATVGGIISAAIYGRIVDWRFSRGTIDFAYRAYFFSVAVTAPACIIGFTADNHTAFIVALLTVQCLLTTGGGPGIAGILMATPAAMRGRMAAMVILVVNLGGFALGAMTIGALTDFVYADPQKVGYSIATAILVFAPIALWCVWTVRPHFVTRIKAPAPS